MLSRIFWIGIAGLALTIGMARQDGGWLFGWADDHAHVSARTEQAIEAGVERAVNRGFEGMQVTDASGNEIDVPAETKRAMADAVGRLMNAEADLAMLKIRDGTAEERQAAETRRDQARADVDRLKVQIENQEQAASLEHGAVREQVRREVRDEIRAEIRN